MKIPSTKDSFLLFVRVPPSAQAYILQGVEEVVTQHDMLNTRRKELLYKQWQEDVYIPLRKSVEAEIERGFPPIDRERRKEHLNYLRYCNLKVSSR